MTRAQATLTHQSREQAGEHADFWNEAPYGFLVLDPSLIILAANSTALGLLGLSASQWIGARLTQFLTEAGAKDFERGAEACLSGTVSRYHGELSVLVSDPPSIELNVRMRASDGRQHLHVIVLSADVRSDRTRLEAELKQARLAASIVAASSDAIFSASTEGLILSWNHGAEALYGYTAAEIMGRPLSLLVPPDKLSESIARRNAVFSGQNIAFETERLSKDGVARPVAISGAPLYDRYGEVVGIAAIHRDISAQVRHETQLRFVMRELAHRTKNLLAIIQSIERQTSRGVVTTEEFHERFSSRLQALAASHDLLVEGNWGGARISDLVQRQLAAFSDQIGDRITVSGPPMRLAPSVAQTLGLALHELATNATKYGALSMPSGRVAIDWGITEDDGKPRFHIEWRETGGPAVSPPSRRGFGLLAIERLAAQALDGEAQVDFSPQGLRWTLSSDPSHLEGGD